MEAAFPKVMNIFPVFTSRVRRTAAFCHYFGRLLYGTAVASMVRFWLFMLSLSTRFATVARISWLIFFPRWHGVAANYSCPVIFRWTRFCVLVKEQYFRIVALVTKFFYLFAQSTVKKFMSKGFFLFIAASCAFWTLATASKTSSNSSPPLTFSTHAAIFIIWPLLFVFFFCFHFHRFSFMQA